MNDEIHIDVTMNARILETGEGWIMVWIDGPFETNSFRIPTEDATTFSRYNELDCRAVIFETGRGGGRLWALYPCLHGEIQVRYQCRDMAEDSDTRTVTKVVEVDEQLSDEEIDRRWTVLWEPDDTDE